MIVGFTVNRFKLLIADFRKQKFKLHQLLLAGGSTLIIAAIMASTISLYRVNSFAQTPNIPATPTLSDVCGSTNPNNLELSTSDVIPTESQAVSSILKSTSISAIGNPSSYITINHYALYNNSGTEEVYLMGGITGPNDSNQAIYIYNLSTGNRINAFNVDVTSNSPDQFSVDPSGNVYVLNEQQGDFNLYKYSPSGSNLWTQSLANANYGTTYGYTDTSDTWVLGLTEYSSITGANDYNQTAQSLVYSQSGSKLATNNMYLYSDVYQDPTTGDIMGVSKNGDMVRVYSDSGSLNAGIETYPLKFSMGTNQISGNGPFHFINIQSIVEEQVSGGYDYIIDDSSLGLIQFSSTGQYLQTLEASDNGQNNDLAQYIAEGVFYNGNYYFTANSIDSLNGVDNYPGLFSISVSNLNAYLNYPEGPSRFGIGAGLSTSQKNNFFVNGNSPSVNLSFYPWWSNSSTNASNLEVQYTVKSISDITSNTTIAPTILDLATLPANQTSPYNFTISIPSTDKQAGAYEVDARLYSKSDLTTAIGADCLDYSVGSTGDAYNPATYNSSSAINIEQAHQLGIKYFRSNYSALIDNCLSSVYDSGSNTLLSQPNSSTQLNCPSNLSSSLQAEQNLANQYGINYVVEMAQTGDNLDTALVAQGQWGRLTGDLAAKFPFIKNWLLWNEINNSANLTSTLYPSGTQFQTGSWVATNVFEPAFNSIKTANSNAQVVVGSSLGTDISFWQSVGSAGGFQYADAIDMHPYTHGNTTFAEDGMVIPPADANPGEASALGSLDQLSKVASDNSYKYQAGKSSIPINDSELGVWNTGTVAYYTQGDKLVQDTVLQNSIGINNISPLTPANCTNYSGGVWGVIGCGYDGGDAPATAAEATMQNMLDSTTNVSGDRPFIGWLPASSPHTYAAEYGPSASDPSTDSGDVVVLWSDDYNVNIVPTLSGGGTINITGDYGTPSSISSGSVMNINSQVQYITVPSGKTLSISPVETYGANQALSSSGATVTVSSTANSVCRTNQATDVLKGVIDFSADDSTLKRCNFENWWAQSPTDTNPSMTIQLKNPTSLDRLFVSSPTLDSVSGGLRSFDISVSPAATGAFTTVGSVNNAFFQRNHLINFAAQTVDRIEITNMTPNFSGYGNGLPPPFWPNPTTASGANQWADQTNPWYGQDAIMDVEAYASGSSTTSKTPPTVSITSPTSSSSNYYFKTVNVSASSSTSSISKVEFYVDGALNSTITSAPYNFSWKTTALYDGAHSIYAVAYDSDGLSTSSSPISLFVTNGDFKGLNNVNYEDAGILSYNYGQSGKTYFQGNINNEPTVDYIDAGLLSKNYSLSW